MLDETTAYDVYCQNCGDEVTNVGAMVSSDCRVFCRDRACEKVAAHQGAAGLRPFNVVEMQTGIVEGTVRNYSPPESLW